MVIKDLIFGKGKHKILLTKAEFKRGKKRYNSRVKRFGLFNDSDGDGFLDFLDGHPRNPKKHTFIGAVASGVGGAIGQEIAEDYIDHKKSLCPTAQNGNMNSNSFDKKMAKGFDKVNPFMLGEKAIRRKRGINSNKNSNHNPNNKRRRN